MKPGIKLGRIIKVLLEQKGFRFFDALQVNNIGTRFHGKIIEYHAADWKLESIVLDTEKVGERVDYYLRFRFEGLHVGTKLFSAFQFYITKGVSQLRVYRYYTRSSYYGFTIDIILTEDTILTLIFMPIDSTILAALIEQLGEEEIPWQTEIGGEIEAPFKTFTSNQ
jgi:hypothetical protein